jgi:hypothetical protein
MTPAAAGDQNAWLQTSFAWGAATRSVLQRLAKLATLVPLPRVYLAPYGGCLAPYSMLRGTICLLRPPPTRPLHHAWPCRRNRCVSGVPAVTGRHPRACKIQFSCVIHPPESALDIGHAVRYANAGMTSSPNNLMDFLTSSGARRPNPCWVHNTSWPMRVCCSWILRITVSGLPTSARPLSIQKS